jgi:hypothetical protein
LLGLLLWVSPIVLKLDDAVALQFLVVGFLVILCELFAFYFLRTLEEWVNIALGIWLIASAWLLFTQEAKAIAIIIGLLLIALSVYEIWDDRRHQAGHS